MDTEENIPQNTRRVCKVWGREPMPRVRVSTLRAQEQDAQRGLQEKERSAIRDLNKVCL